MSKTNNILVDKNFKAIRKGSFVEADASAGEFLLNESSELTLAQLKEVAAANNVKLTATKKTEAAKELVDAIMNNKEIPTMNEPTQSQKIKALVEAGLANGKSDDDLLIEIVQSGVKFSAATKELALAKQALGVTVSNKDRYEQAKKVMAEAKFKPADWNAVVEMSKKLAAGIKDTTEKQAIALIRKYAKEIEVEMPKAPEKVKGEKKAGGEGGTNGFRGKVIGFLTANPTATVEQYTAFVKQNAKEGSDEDKTKSLVNKFMPLLKMANAIHAKAKVA